MEINNSLMISVLKKNREKQVVELPKVSNAREFWGELTSYVYRCFPNHLYNDAGDVIVERIDYKIESLMTRFAGVDSLDLLTKKGKILKRLAAYIKSESGIKIPDKYMGIIGDRLQYYVTQETREFFVDFTDSIDWDDGKFGKHGSCWWGMYSDSRKCFTDGGGWALRFYDSMEDRHGIGRLWIMPKYNVLLCFNAYGVERAKASKVIKAVFDREGIELHYSRTDLYNSYSDEIPYINTDDNPGSSGAFVLYVNETDLKPRYDIDCEYDDDKSTCDRCGRRVDDDETTRFGDSTYCQRCTENYLSYCESCEEYCYSENVHTVHNARGYDSYMCSDCLRNSDYSQCDRCEEWHEVLTSTDMHNDYCEDCLERESFYCGHCGEYIEGEVQETHDQENHAYCEICGEYTNGTIQEHNEVEHVIELFAY